MRRLGHVAVIVVTGLTAVVPAAAQPAGATRQPLPLAEPLRAASVAPARTSTRQLDVNAYATAGAGASGNRFTLVLEVLPKAGMHVYAPGARDYRVVNVTVTPQPFLRVHPTRYPASETYHFTPLNERVQVFRKPFLLSRDVVVDTRRVSSRGASGPWALAIAGALEYQACDERICYNPVSVPVAWTVTVRPAVAAQTRAPAPAASALVTPWGDPDLQGIWPSGALIDVPFERPREFGTRAELTDAEFARRAAQIARQVDADTTGSALPEESEGIGAPRHWRERGRASRLTSLVVVPPDGRLPPMTADGRRRAAAWPDAGNTAAFAQPSDMVLYDRCITRGVLGSIFPNLYSSGTEIVQAPGVVVIRHEMIHETRIVPVDGRPPLTPAIRSYMGDSRGRWEGQTLVVETRNFNGTTGSLGRNANGNPTSQALRLVERFTRVDAETLHYEVRIDDPQTWTRSWTVAFPLTRDPGYTMFEYACHEGNYAMRHILSAARASERAAAAASAPNR